jgi:hypothetical protein
VGKKPTHRVAVERRQVSRVELLVVRNEELLGDGAAKARVEHLEVVLGLLRHARRAREIQVVQTVDDVLLWQLVDVLLKGEVDLSALEGHERLLLDAANVLPRHARAEPHFDVAILEVKEVARVVPHEAVLPHDLAVAADFRIAFEHHEVAALAERRRGREPGDASADDQHCYVLHGARLAA